MATYQVGADGNAPKDAVVGDTIVTQGGSYQVLDGSAYKGFSPEQLQQQGVGYNPSSGLYSKKVSGVKSDQVSLIGRGGVDDWLQSANTQAKAEIGQAYNTGVASVNRDYNTNRGEYENSIEGARREYFSAIDKNKRNAYYDANAAIEGAGQRGLMNSAQGQAMTNASLWNSSLNETEITRDKDQLVNMLKRDINILTKNKNITLTELEQKKLNAELDKMSANQIQYIATMMDIDKYNTDAVNQVNLKNVDQAHQKELLAIQLAASGGRGGGGSGYRAGTNGSYGDEISSDANTADMIAYISSIKPGWEEELNKKFMLYQLGKLSKESLDKAVNEKYYKLEQEEVQNTIQNSGTRINDDGKTVPIYTGKKDKTKPSVDEILYKNKGYNVGFGLRGY